MAITLNELKATLDEKLTSFKVELRNDLIMEISQEFKSAFKTIEDKLQQQDEKVEKLNCIIKQHDARITELEVKLDDQVNRSMRLNLILKGVPEKTSTIAQSETWEETKALVTDTLHQHTGGNKDGIFNSIDRAHRGGKSYNGKPRNIYMKLFNTDDVKHYHELFRRACVADRNLKIKIDYQFSDRVQTRRNEAMKKRHQLLKDKQIISGYLLYPAKLMVKNTGDHKYTMCQEF